MVLAKYRPIDQWKRNRKPRNKPMHILSSDLQQGFHEYVIGKGQSLQQIITGKTEYPQTNK